MDITSSVILDFISDIKGDFHKKLDKKFILREMSSFPQKHNENSHYVAITKCEEEEDCD